MTYFLETEKAHNEGRNVVITRSNVRSRYGQHFQPSGEMRSQINGSIDEDNDSIDENEAAIKPLTLSELQQRTEARMREKNMKANEDSVTTINSGKSANRKVCSRRSSQKLSRQ